MSASAQTIDEVLEPSQHPKAPGRRLLLMELRALPELAGFAAAVPGLLAATPRGDGQPVLVLPGLVTSDRSTISLRGFLSAKGYPTYGWEQGRNFGPLPGVEEGLKSQLARLADQHGRKVSIVGWSLGGIYARQMAKMMPDLVRQVITLGSPFKGDPRATNAWKLYQYASGHKVDDRDNHMGGIIAAPAPVPSTAIFSRSDGICHWENCMEDPSDIHENIRVRSSHCGLGHHPAAVYAIADRLAQPEGEWKPFDRTGVKGFAFPKVGELD
ncbi:MAG: alpha/beta hydrolase [Pseudomonadota bacterium]